MILLRDAPATEALGRAIAPLLAQGDVIALFGDLGAGKTTLTRGILTGLGHSGEVASPTFPIVQSYDDLPLPLWHVDLYRIEDPGEVAELGLEEAEAGALIVEWPDRLDAPTLASALRLAIAPEPGGGRRLTLGVPAAWERRWPLR